MFVNTTKIFKKLFCGNLDPLCPLFPLVNLAALHCNPFLQKVCKNHGFDGAYTEGETCIFSWVSRSKTTNPFLKKVCKILVAETKKNIFCKFPPSMYAPSKSCFLQTFFRKALAVFGRGNEETKFSRSFPLCIHTFKIMFFAHF